MSNPTDQKIIEWLANDPTGEMNAYKLEELLKKELSKEAEEIDTPLVNELLEALEPVDMPEGLKEQVWQRIQERRTPARKATPWLRRIAAAAAIAIVALGLAFGAAQAFRWTFVLKPLQPVAHTFGIYLNYADDQQPAVTVPEVPYGVSQEESSQHSFEDLSAVPDEHQSYALKPGRLPEGYTFVQASCFSDLNLTKYAICYQRGTDELNVFIILYPDTASVSSQVFERMEDVVSERTIASRNVTFYRNALDQIQSVFWAEGNIHYSISGHITPGEAERLIESFSNQHAE